MPEFQQNFLDESINNLRILQKRLAEEFTDDLRREAFRTVHTIKGGAQVLGMENTARFAERFENVLAGGPRAVDRERLLAGVDFLLNSLGQKEPAESALPQNPPTAEQTAPRSDILFSQIPSEVFRNFSSQERSATLAALREGKNIYCAEAGFEIANFADEYRKLRKILGENCDILASLPSEKYKSSGKIGFRIFLASRETSEKLQDSAKDFTIEISSHACTENDSKDLYGMLAQIAAHGEKTALKAGKQIGITILSNDLKLTAGQTNAFFEILLHLVRNAVDHAIDACGTIEIRFFEEPEGIYVAVADDGCGVNLAKVRARAVAKNLIADDDELNEQETLSLIFASELSTAARVTEISGRGVGLDAVKTAVEKMNGKISVKNRKTKGAIFEIFVPTTKA